MSKLTKDLSIGTLHPRENLYNSTPATLGATNAEVIIDSDGCSTLSLDVRNTFAGTIEVSGTIDGNNWTLIPIRILNNNTVQYLASTTASGSFVGKCAAFKKVRARMTTFSSGAALVILMASTAVLDDSLQGTITPFLSTITSTIGAGATLTLPTPGAGLRQYLTYLRIVKFAGAVLLPAATPVVVTTSNLPGSLAFTMPADAAAQGTQYSYQEDFSYPVVASFQNAGLTISCPVTTGVIWRITAGYYVAP